MSKEKKVKKNRGLMLALSLLSFSIMAGVLVGILFLTNPDAMGQLGSIKDKFSKPPVEFYSEPLELTAALIHNKNDSKHYLKAKIVVSTYNEDELETIKNSEIKFYDTYIEFFSTIEYEDTLSPKTQQKIKEQLKNKLNNDLELNIVNIYFKEFLSQ